MQNYVSFIEISNTKRLKIHLHAGEFFLQIDQEWAAFLRSGPH